ncbi:MAG TPA: NifB/NifX family molybdenum-iron cluster-binding protein [Bacteroidales bacterium]|nr:NifB/NifX family molybdenum-iron cluster-binding protein [Bacteroidales bacterium]
MKIAIPVTSNDRIHGHFGKSDQFSIYTISDKKISAVDKIPSFQGSGCKSGIATVLAEMGVSVILSSGIGGGAIKKLDKAGIEIIRGCEGSPEENVMQYINGELTDRGSTCEKHHHHEHEHKHSESGQDGSAPDSEGLRLR